MITGMLKKNGSDMKSWPRESDFQCCNKISAAYCHLTGGALIKQVFQISMERKISLKVHFFRAG
jgi:hypothetical protein